MDDEGATCGDVCAGGDRTDVCPGVRFVIASQTSPAIAGSERAITHPLCMSRLTSDPAPYRG